VTARLWTRLDVICYRWVGASIGACALGLSDVLVLRTRGRRSGQVRAVLVACVEVDGVPVVCGANAGSDTDPAWFKNLVAGSPVEIERHRRRIAVTPVLLEGPERTAAFDAVYRAFPHVRLYLARTSRPFPLLRLEPVDPPREPGAALAGNRLSEAAVP
jgi:deazaflavin-dependent oxidoreductase (nitroreductase family)